MHYFKRIALWIIAITITLSTVSTRLIEAEISEDLRSNLGCVATTESYRLMPEEKVNQILREKLVIFPQSRVSSLSHHIFSLCKKFRFDPAFVLSVIQVESNFKVRAKSNRGAIGLMQVMPHTALHVLRQLTVHSSGKENYRLDDFKNQWVQEEHLFNPYLNTAIGIAYLAWLRDYYHGSAYHTLAAYNLGPARLDQLLSKKRLNPNQTRRYFHAIQQGMGMLRLYEVGHVNYKSQKKNLVKKRSKEKFVQKSTILRVTQV
jgi:hypothetical protein